MAFVNEFVSEEEIAKYGLDALMKKHNQRGWKWGRPPGFKHHWTIDRERSAFLLTLRKGSRVGPSGNPEPTSQRFMLLNFAGTDYLFEMDRGEGTSESVNDIPVRVVWRITAYPESFGVASIEEQSRVESLFKEAVIAYGNFGAWRQIPNTVVSFVK